MEKSIFVTELIYIVFNFSILILKKYVQQQRFGTFSISEYNKSWLKIVERRKSLKSLYFQYQTEAMPKGISIEQFCSRNKVPYNINENMTAEEQKRYINYLAERLEKADLGLRARDAVLQDFLDKQKEYDERLSKLDDIVSKVSSLESSLKEKERKLKSAERKVADLKAKLKFANDLS